MTHQYQPGELIEVNLTEHHISRWLGDGRKYIGMDSRGNVVYETIMGGVFKALTAKVRPIPKVRKGWVNIYKSFNANLLATTGSIYATKEEALLHKTWDKYLGTVEIEWTEKA